MRKGLIALAAMLCVFGLSGCSKNQTPGEARDEKYLVEDYKVYYYDTPDEFMDFLGGSTELRSIEQAGLILDVLSIGSVADLVNKLFFENIVGGEFARIRIERHNFQYKSLDGEGNPIILSGTLVLPSSANKDVPHRLDDITLCHPWYMTNEECPSVDGNLVMYRAVYNEAVIIPDSQGMGTTYGLYKPPFTEWPQLARQTIDCELAALELMKDLNVTLAKDYVTKGMAMSKGAPVMVEVQRMLENTEPAWIRNLIRLESTYSACGPYDTFGMFTDTQTWDADPTDMWALLLLINSAYYAHPSEFRNFRLSDFYSDEFNSFKVSDGKGGEYTLADQISDKFDVDRGKFEESGLDAVAKILNPRFFREDGSFNEDDALVSRFFKILKSNNPTVGWTPKARILLEHSMIDHIAAYKYSSESYKDLKTDDRGISNPNVAQHVYSSLSHGTISSMAVGRMMILENPAYESIIDNLDLEALMEELPF